MGDRIKHINLPMERLATDQCQEKAEMPSITKRAARPVEVSAITTRSQYLVPSIRDTVALSAPPSSNGASRVESQARPQQASPTNLEIPPGISLDIPSFLACPPFISTPCLSRLTSTDVLSPVATLSWRRFELYSHDQPVTSSPTVDVINLLEHLEHSSVIYGAAHLVTATFVQWLCSGQIGRRLFLAGKPQSWPIRDEILMKKAWIQRVQRRKKGII
ncbi:hypothetical protein DFH09DRAFT_1103268 [Mycena vulgaris]|nr:hypothetical protein DFH09DRAFT_1103268 [Mycena vulgaris]